LKKRVRSSKKVLPEIGEVSLRHSARAKRLSITIKPFEGVQVTIPKGMPEAQARRFLFRKINWIRRTKREIQQVEQDFKSGTETLQPVDFPKAKKELISRLRFLASEHGFQFNRITIRNQKTRWGSCSSKNNINLNVNLVRLSQELIDYVLLHELVHTRVKNHSPKFWAELDKYLGDAKRLRNRLREFPLNVFHFVQKGGK